MIFQWWHAAAGLLPFLALSLKYCLFQKFSVGGLQERQRLPSGLQAKGEEQQRKVSLFACLPGQK